MHRKTHSTNSNPERQYATIFTLVFATLLFLNVFNRGSVTYHGQYSFSSNNADNTKTELDNALNSRTEIVGYWKEVRTSLGLGLLPDVVLFHGKAVKDNINLSHNPKIAPASSRGAAHGNKNIIHLSGNQLYRERLGRLHPAQLRRRELFEGTDDPGSYYAGEDYDWLSSGSEDLDSDTDGYDAETNSFGPEPFLAKDSEFERTLSTQAHAAAFRAIAARELRQHLHHQNNNKAHRFLKS